MVSTMVAKRANQKGIQRKSKGEEENESFQVQRRSTKVNEGQQRSTKVNKGQQRSTKVNEGQ